MKEKESPSQLSDFVAAAAAEAAASEPTLPSTSTLSLDDTHNQTATSDEQTPVSRAFSTVEMLKRKSSSNTNSSSSSTSTPNSPLVQQKCHSRSSSSSSASNSSLQKKAKLTDELNNNNRSLNDLSQFVQLNNDERTPQPSASNQSNETEKITVTNKSDSSTTDAKFVID